MTALPCRRILTCSPGSRNSFGSRTACDRPDQKSFAVCIARLTLRYAIYHCYIAYAELKQAKAAVGVEGLQLAFLDSPWRKIAPKLQRGTPKHSTRPSGAGGARRGWRKRMAFE